MPLNKQEQILYNTVKKLTGKLIHQCRLRHADENELIQAGCLACLEAKAKPQDYKEIAKKAILKCYYKEANIQKKQVTDVKIGKVDEDHKKNLVEEVLPAKEQLSDEERQEADKQQGLEWEDLPPDLPEDLKNDILAYRDHGIKGYLWTKTFIQQAYNHRKRTIAQCQEIIQGNNAVLQLEIKKNLPNLKKGYAIYSPYTNYILRKLNWNNTKENKHIVKKTLYCPLIRLVLQGVEPNFTKHVPIKINSQVVQTKKKRYHHTAEQILLREVFYSIAIHNTITTRTPYARYIINKMNMTTEPVLLSKVKRSLECPLVRLQLKKIDADFDLHCPSKESSKPNYTAYNRLYYQQTQKKIIKYKLRDTPTTRKIVRSKCPLISDVLEKGLLVKHNVNLAINTKLEKSVQRRQQLTAEYPDLSKEEIKVLDKHIQQEQSLKKTYTNKQYLPEYLLLQQNIREQYFTLTIAEQDAIIKREWAKQKAKEAYQKNKAILASALAKIQQHDA